MGGVIKLKDNKQIMKIIFSNYDDIKNPYYAGGGAYAIQEVAKRLSKNNQLTVVTGAYPGSKDEVVDGVIYKRIGFKKLGPRISQLIFQALLPFYVIKLDFDVWIESYTPPFSTAFLPIFTKKPIIGLTQILSGKSMSEKYHLPFYTLEKFGLRFYKNIIVLSEHLNKKIKEIDPRIKTHLSSNGVSSSLIYWDKPKASEYILFLGRIDVRQKGLDLLVKSYASIKDKIGLKLVVAGAGKQDDMKELRRLIAEHRLEDKVEVLGRVEGDTKEELFRKAKFFTMSSRFEAMPLTLLEAMCYKCPVIYYNIDVLEWVPDDVAIKVSPFDAEEFGRKMLELSNDEESLKRYTVAGKNFVRKFDWDIIASRYQEIANEIVGENI